MFRALSGNLSGAACCGAYEKRSGRGEKFVRELAGPQFPREQNLSGPQLGNLSGVAKAARAARAVGAATAARAAWAARAARAASAARAAREATAARAVRAGV